MKRSKVRNNGITHLDDGGSAKSSDRLNRRRRKRNLKIIKYPLGIGIGIILIFLFRRTDVKDAVVEQRRKTNKALNSLRSRLKLVNSNSNTNNKGRGGGGLRDTDDDHKNHNDAPRDDDDHRDHQAVPKYRWAEEAILPPVHGEQEWTQQFLTGRYQAKRGDFKILYGAKTLDWEHKAKLIPDRPPKLDYTKHLYEYPSRLSRPPRGGSYPPLEPLGDLLQKWPQNDIDTPPSPFVERLQHFDFNDEEQMEAAQRYRDLEFPFKLTHVPELIAANEKWTDEYLSFHFDRKRRMRGQTKAQEQAVHDAFEQYEQIPKSDGHCQESKDSFFAFFSARNWNIDTMGPAPTRDTDFTYQRWANHARYADSAGIPSNESHYYWQSGVSDRQRNSPRDEWTMISRDLPTFSDPEPNFISFNPDEQKGIQCRFGERGVTAATHYDGGRNMIGMITGAKRYILSPPRECPKVST